MLEHAAPVISDFLTGFQRNPEGAAEDSELRKALFSALFQQYDRLDLQFSYDKEDLDIQYYPDRDKIRLNPVRTAYPAPEKFDIALLDTMAPGQKATDEEDDRFKAYWRQPVAAAITLHLCVDSDIAGKYLRKLDRDLKKMAAYSAQKSAETEFAGLALLMVAGDAPEGVGAEVLPEIATGLQAWVIASDGIFQYPPSA